MTGFPWHHYAYLQDELDDFRVSDRSWGIEAALNRIVAGDFTDSTTINIDIGRTIANEERRERYRAALRRLHLTTNDASPHAEEHLVARAELRAAEAKTTKKKWRLLVAIGEGHDYAELAAAEGATIGSLRAKVFRLRREIA
jgi:phage/plasmid primase-like uncharacterized protein